MNRLRYGARITVAGVIAVLSLALMPSGVRADHEAGHDSMARGGIKALDEKVFDLQTSLANIELGGVSFSAGASSGTLPDDDFGFPFSTEFHDSQDDFEPALNGIPAFLVPSDGVYRFDMIVAMSDCPISPGDLLGSLNLIPFEDPEATIQTPLVTILSIQLEEHSAFGISESGGAVLSLKEGDLVVPGLLSDAIPLCSARIETRDFGNVSAQFSGFRMAN